jgi:hypothetical protein
MAVIKSNIAKKYSTKAFFLLFFTKFLIPEPNAAQTEIDNGQITKAVIEIKRIAIINYSSFGKNPEATIVEMVQAFGFTN